MEGETKIKLVLGFIIAFLVIFTYASFVVQNVEFSFYSVIILSFFLTGYRYRERLHLNPLIFSLMAILTIVHVIGGFLYVGDGLSFLETEGSVRLYDMQWGPFQYDNIVHFFASFVVAIMIYNLMVLHMKTIRKHTYLLTFIIIFASMGIGALNEIIEFFGVAFLGAQGVGGYFNNSKDLFYNMLGAIWGVVVVDLHNKRRVKNPLSPILDAALYDPEKESKLKRMKKKYSRKTKNKGKK